MLKSCPSCSYIGDDEEHICPFCKIDLALGRPRRNSLRLRLLASAVAFVACATLSACSVDPNGPASSGASQGSLGSANMSDYYYHKQAGYTYVYKNVENIYNQDGDVVSTLRGANDTIRTMGFDGFAPSGDSMFRVAFTYRVRTTFAGRNEMDMFYVCQGNTQRGGFIDGDPTPIYGAKNMVKRPRPISTDTILAGVAGRVRTVADDFNNIASSVWQTDTLWFCSTGDSVYIWERFPGQTTLSRSRLLFCRDFVTNTSWTYDLIWGDTYFKVNNPDMQVTVPQGTFPHCAKINVYTPEVDDNMPTWEHKWFACGAGLIKQYDHWNVTTDGQHFNEQDYTHSLISLTHN